MKTAQPTLVLADAHLRGYGDPAQATMVEFLAANLNRASGLVILGDFFEFLAGSNASAADAYGPALNELSKWDSLDYVEGNHDFDLSTGFPGLRKARIHPGPTNLKLGDLHCKLLHGDRSSPGDLGTRVLRFALQSTPVRVLRDRLLPDEVIFRIALAFAGLSRRRTWPGRSAESQQARKRARNLIHKPDTDAVLFAHTHKALLERAANGLIANPGPAVPGGSYLEVEARTIRLCRFPDGEPIAAESA